MKYWVTPEEMAEYDRRAIENETPGDVLMERAGTAAAETAMKMTKPENGPVIVFAGPGNNGGDGLVLARKLGKSAYKVFVVLAAVAGRSLSHDCQTNLGRYAQGGGTVLSPKNMHDLPDSAGLVVDALLGTGFRGEIRDVFAECLEKIKDYDCKVLAVDTPSGINGKTGKVDPLAVRADVTITFAAPKAGLLFPPGCSCSGSIFTADIGIGVDESSNRMIPGLSDVSALLPDRPVDGHKGTFGRLLLVGGSETMPGAPQLMSLGALRSGAGLVTLSVPLSAHQLIAGRIPEVLSSYFLPGDAAGITDPGNFQAAAVGPGMGNNTATKKVITHILKNWSVPLVLDADALNVLDDHPATILKEYAGPLLITPHPGEMSRLMKCDPSNIVSRSWAARRLAESAGITVILKGRPTMVFHQDKGCCTIPAGNSGLATGGSGDILTGIVSSLMAQGMEPFDAGVLGVYVHGLAADIAIENSSERSLIPSDVASSLGKAFRVIEKGGNSDLLTSGGKWNSDYL
ncbi:MAG: NAD(P)H-hydrate dehydratase [Candidatus Aegiribacteria sp.]|nr:NAD(P)H-hydrate dehydratase [Candidatus Aegiribacteria sp.]